ncbi:helix-turn-helix transcriptional regulator [Pseudomonas sp. PDNC002]|uniref:helix-turn-helix domain-containing protein n=1 Tax=Pseudomonas sp. PDNC002 TaxID=2811422 RepID=UPI001962CE4B|nr:helix-turn-helix transcriptional regulator [Pseudomonas sp. PDNC002]QRY76909.1 helix-turn-helix transcriptional regulator [Pseudomonas sp. PDNC002]
MTETDQNNLAGLVGQAIAKQRIRKGLTQEQVAEQLRIGNEAVSRIERGKVVPNIARLLEFAAVFECGVAELLTEASPHPDDQMMRLHDLLSTLSPHDRQLVMDVVERLVEHLGPH